MERFGLCVWVVEFGCWCDSRCRVGGPREMEETRDGGVRGVERIYIYFVRRILNMGTQWQDLSADGAIVLVVVPVRIEGGTGSEDGIQ